MPIIEMKNVTKRYGNKPVVDNISLCIEQGEMFGYLGPNGAGKSTSISMICGLIKADQGEILVDGYSITKNSKEAKAAIGLVPQEIALYQSLSARENLEFWGSMYGLRGALLRERIEEALEIAGLKDRGRDKIESFSGGMKRRINIASAIMHHPKIIIMDEPTVGIDPQSRNHILEATKLLNKEYGSTILYTSHYMEEVEFLCKHIAIIDQGRIIAQGTKEEIKRIVMHEEKMDFKVSEVKPEALEGLKKLSDIRGVELRENTLTVLLKGSQNKLQEIIEILIKHAVKIHGIDIKEPNLEAVFLSLTGKSLRD